jgi:hypothetical protein
MHLIIGHLVVYLVLRCKPITIFKIVVSFMIGFSIIMAGYVIFMGKPLNTKILTAPAKRVVGGQIGAAYFYLKIFPGERDYLYGRALPNPSGIFPFEPISLAKQVQDYMRPGLRDRNIHGSAPAAYWVNLYANFGRYVPIFVSFIIGILLYALPWFMLKEPLSPLKIALIAWLALHYAKISVTSLGTFITDVKLFAVICCYLFLKYGPSTRDIVMRRLSRIPFFPSTLKLPPS